MSKGKRTTIYFDRETFKFVGLDDATKMHLEETYKGVNIERELNKMGLWLSSDKGKRRHGNMSFIMNWLGNASPSQEASESSDKRIVECDSNLGSLIQEYLTDLWKNREHILEFNTRRR